jgi:hypothetical protein
MNTIKKLLLAMVIGCSGYAALAQGTAFTYQGRLNDGPSPANGSYDLTFALFDAAVAGTQQGATTTNMTTAVSNGLFTVTLDFGSQFPGADRWLEIAVRTNGAELFAVLEPRQALTATPYAITAGGVSTAAQLNASSLNSGTVADARLSTNVALRLGGNTFSGTQFINGALNVNSPGFGAAASIIRAREGDQFPFAAQSFSGVNLLLVSTNGVSISGPLNLNGNLTGAPNVALRTTANTFTNDQRIEGTLNLNAAPFPGVTAFLRARPGDNLPLAVQGTNGVNLLLVNTNGQVNIAGLLQVGNASTPNSLGMITLASRSGSGAAARTWEVGVPETENDVTGVGYSFVINDTQNGPAPELMVKFGSGNVGIGTTNPATKLDVSGEVTCTAVNVTSDRNAKKDFKAVDSRAVLDKVTRMPISEWAYKAQADTRHIGPMAQDFHAAFGLGRDEKHITSVDADGVALAAIQGLNAKLEEQVRAKEARIDELEKAVAELRAVMGLGGVKPEAGK